MSGGSLIHSVLDEQATERPDQDAFVFEGESYSYDEFARRTRRAAGALSTIGVEPGSVIVAHANNHVDLYTLFYACSRLGAVFTPFSPHRSDSQLEYMLEKTPPAAVFYTMDEDVVEGSLDSLRRLVPDADCISLDSSSRAGDRTFSEILSRAGETPVENPVDPSVDHNVFWTSGTTGRPKAVVRNHVDSLGFIRPSFRTFPFEPGSIRLLPRHMMYVAAYLHYGIPAIMHGETTVLLRSFSVESVVEAVEEFDIYVSSLGVTPAKRVLDHLEREDSSIDIETSHTVLPSREFASRLLERVHDEIYHVYSTTEVGAPFITYFDPDADDNDPPLVGTAGDGVEARLVQADPDRSVDPGDTVSGTGSGELIVRGVTTMTRYLDEGTQRRKVQNGWVYTGDRFRRNEEGEYQYLGRVDNRIRSGGVNVYPEPIERALTNHPAVTEAVVVGVPDDEWGERVAAVIVASDPAPEDDLSASLEEFCHANDEISRQLRPREFRFVDSIDDIPKGGRGKYDRSAIARSFEA